MLKNYPCVVREIEGSGKMYHCITVNVSLLLIFFLHVQARAYGSVDGKLTLNMVDECVEDMLQQHQQKQLWEKGTQTSTLTS